MSKRTNGKRTRIQPRCKHGHRIPKTGTIHESVLYGLQRIAKSENKSVSWVMHEIIADWFKLDIMGDKQ
jgi:hypothetical protein